MKKHQTGFIRLPVWKNQYKCYLLALFSFSTGYALKKNNLSLTVEITFWLSRQKRKKITDRRGLQHQFRDNL
jgi:hypothetical protein